MNKSDQHSRLVFIDFVLYWDGAVQNRQLTYQFGISRQQAWQDLQCYAERFPANIAINIPNKPYCASPCFTPQLMVPDIDSYLHWVQTPAIFSHSAVGHLPQNSNLQLPPRQVNPAIIRTLVQAMRSQQRVEADYVSLTNPDREGRIISPYTFVNTGLRWHLRGWCEKHQEYRDFVLSRFRGEAEILGESEKTGIDDEVWHNEVELILVPDRRLTPEQQAVIAHDYQMEEGKLHIKTRAALAQYVLQQMQVNIKTLDAIPEAQQLELVNLNDVKPWLFG